jgi:uncharacterized membrane protein YwaF
MTQYFAGDYAGEPFQLFGLAHLIALGVIVLINIVLIYTGPRFPLRWRDPFRYALAVLLIGDELAWHWWNWSTGQ